MLGTIWSLVSSPVLRNLVADILGPEHQRATTQIEREPVRRDGAPRRCQHDGCRTAQYSRHDGRALVLRVPECACKHAERRNEVQGYFPVEFLLAPQTQTRQHDR